MKSSNNISFLRPLKVYSCWRQHKRTIPNSIGQIIFLNSEAYCCHFSHCQTPILHVLSPSIHSAAPFWKVTWNYVVL